MVFNDVIETIGMIIDAAGVAVIVTGAAAASVGTAVRLSRRDSAVYPQFRQQLGQAILLGLELFVAGDIVRTVAASPSLTGVAILAAIVLIRTFLSFSLQVETTGQWPWQKRDNSPPLDQSTAQLAGQAHAGSGPDAASPAHGTRPPRGHVVGASARNGRTRWRPGTMHSRTRSDRRSARPARQDVS